MAKLSAIEQQIEQFKLDEDVAAKRQDQRLKKIPKKLRQSIEDLFGSFKDGDDDDDDEELDYQARRELEQKKEDQAVAKFEKLSASDRQAVFAVFAPKVAQWMEKAWQHLKSTPYTVGYAQRSFRAPGNPQATLQSRFRWVRSFVNAISDLDPDIVTLDWLAQWAPHVFHYQSGVVVPLLIVALDSKGREGDEVLEILRQSVTREHPIGRMGEHVIESLLGSSRTAGWELMEKTLLAAKRQEGLRQSILESVDRAHPQAFARMMQLILDEDLVRFSSVARCVNVWFGLAWDSASAKVFRDNVEMVLKILDSPAERKKAIASKDPETVFRGLWASAFHDAEATVPLAAKLLKHKSEEHRFVGTWVLFLIGLSSSETAKIAAIDDDCLEVACLAAFSISGLDKLNDDGESFEVGQEMGVKSKFDALERLHERLPAKPTRLKAMVWPWTERKVDRKWLASQMIESLGDRPPTRLLPYLKSFDSWEQKEVIELLAAQNKWNRLTRSSLFELAGHASKDVRGAAFDALDNQKLAADERKLLEGYLSRKSSDLRIRCIEMVCAGKEQDGLASAAQLLNAGNLNQRLAGLEVLRQMADANRLRSECQALATTYRENAKKLNKEEQSQLKAIADSNADVVSLDDALGLMDPAKRTPVELPVKNNAVRITKAALKCISELDDLIHQHRDTIVTSKTSWDTTEEALGSLSSYNLPNLRLDKPLKPQLKNFPMIDDWMAWNKKRPASTKDKDGFELIRALVALSTFSHWNYESVKRWVKKKASRKQLSVKILGQTELPKKLRYESLIEKIITWLSYINLPRGYVDYLLDCTEDTLAVVPDAEMQLLIKSKTAKSNRRGYHDDDRVEDWRNNSLFSTWPDVLDEHIRHAKPKLSKQQKQRWLKLKRFLDEPIPGAPRNRLPIESLMDAYQAKMVSKDDIVDCLLGPNRNGYGHGFNELEQLTRRPTIKEYQTILNENKFLVEILEQARSRILDIELARGESETPASEAAIALQSVFGIDVLFRILNVLGKSKLKTKSWYSESNDRLSSLTHLLRSTYPKENDSTAAFSKMAKQAIADGAMEESRLLELAFVAPQWTKFVEAFLDWDGFSEGLYWFIAHMNTWNTDAENAAASAEGLEDDFDDDEDFEDEPDEDSDSIPKPKKLSAWERLVIERTPLSAEHRNEGAVDVGWFKRTWKELGGKRWKEMAEAARFAANSAQAKKAQFLADVLLGNTPKKTLVDGIKQKNLKQNVRLLGLLPLADGKKQSADIADRYEVLQAYKKYASKLSGLTKPEAMRAASIGFENLARLAGYPDPLRLEWAMEADSVRDLAKGPVSVTKDGVTVTLRLNEDAKPELTVMRGEKTLKSVPAATRKKHAAISDLVDRGKDLKKKSSRIKHSLETAMCRGDVILGDELKQLFEHPILAPQLSRLVLIGDGIMGYPDKHGKALRDAKGKLEPVKSAEELRIAHPADLLASKKWDLWQRECFQAERVQPFKQIFRELYVVTSQEKKDGKRSSRFAGQQIGPRQAMALLGSRGWNTQDEVFKIFHDQSIIAEIQFQYDIGTAAEIEGLTMDTVSFRQRDDHRSMKLAEVPKNLFSEVMRDVDLVVSVAHRGEVDPEASASTVEMRTLLVSETCQLLGLENVKLKKSHAIIDGYYGKYSLHLGSGNVQRLPGGSLSIVAVHSQHRGRIFLPFADDDPRTAEVISKVLLLARDEEILDPTILDQLGAPVSKRKSIVSVSEAESEPNRKSKSESLSKSAKAKSAKAKSKRASKKAARTTAALEIGASERYELVEGNSNKFWEIKLLGTEVTTTWGRIGTKGQTKTKPFDDVDSAKAEYQKLVKAKTGKGYKLT